jgi:hypothetical protein
MQNCAALGAPGMNEGEVRLESGTVERRWAFRPYLRAARRSVSDSHRQKREIRRSGPWASGGHARKKEVWPGWVCYHTSDSARRCPCHSAPPARPRGRLELVLLRALEASHRRHSEAGYSRTADEDAAVCGRDNIVHKSLACNDTPQPSVCRRARLLPHDHPSTPGEPATGSLRPASRDCTLLFLPFPAPQ